MLTLEALSLIIGYLLGSIPTAYIAVRFARGEDIRNLGDHNVGATNAAQELGWKVGALVLIVDAGKGAGAFLIARALGVPLIWIFLAGFAAVVGHCWPVWLKFRGGRGVATGIGLFLALAPVPAVCCLPITLPIVYFTGNVVLTMFAGSLFFLLFLWVFGQPLSMIVFAVFMIVFVIVWYIPFAIRLFREAGSIRNFLISKDYKTPHIRRKRAMLS